MRPYEVMAIFDATTEPTVIQGVLDHALEVIRGAGGNPGTIDRWGRRQFAYEVNHKREGYYVIVEFTGEPQTVVALDRMLGLADEVVRHKVVRLPERGAGAAASARASARASAAAPATAPSVAAGAGADASTTSAFAAS
jgi:small subunit ribosomal protein S6